MSGITPPPVSLAELSATFAVVYTHDGTSYQVDGGRIFIGTEDPADDGFTPSVGDIWIGEA